MDKKELNNILSIFDALAEFKTSILDFYEACAECYKEDKVFFSSFIEEERYRIQDIKRMASIINDRPRKFEIGVPFKFSMIKIFLLYSKNAVRKIKNCELSKRDALIAGLNIELSAIGTKFNEIIMTSDLEYLGVAKDVNSNIVVHRSRLNKKINDLDKITNQDKEKGVQLQEKLAHNIPDRDNKYFHPVIDIVVIHNQFREYLELFKEVLVEDNIMPHVWENIEKVVRFNQYEIEEHFLFEETYIFNKLNENPQYLEIVPVLDELIADHKKLKKMLADIETILFKSDMPLLKEKAEKLKVILVEFIDLVLLHLSKEEEKILPLLNTMKQ